MEISTKANGRTMSSIDFYDIVLFFNCTARFNFHIFSLIHHLVAQAIKIVVEKS